MVKSAFDPRLLEKYSEPKLLLHFQWGDDNKVYRYALVEIINEHEIDATSKCKKDEQGLTQQQIYKKICQEQH
jgi:hypothetical protein